MANVLPATVVLSGSRIFAGFLLLFGYLMKGDVYDPPFEVDQDVINSFVVTLNKLTQCGISGEGGTDAKAGQWPWMAYIFQRKLGRKDGFICGATLINSHWIVTAAHCIQQSNSPEEYGVILGERRVSVISGNEREFNITSIVRHKDYDPILVSEDIALLKLSKPVLFTKYIRPICIPLQGFPTDATIDQLFQGQSISYSGKKCIILGWGQTENKHKSDVLQQLNVTVFPRVICNAVTRGSKSASYASIVNEDSTRFCAYGGEGQDTCYGDSGGPLVCLNEDENRYYLHGVTSHGPKPCGQRNLPAVYTKVSDFRKWIDENIK